MKQNLEHFDEQVFLAIQKEEKRQRDNLELIASENIVSTRVRAASASVLTNKYAEGYPARRYYSGCEYVDITENLAIERAKKLFGATHANVQAHSGSQANMAVYFSVLEAGDKVLGMDLSNGGHLTHGSKVNFSGFLFENAFYEVHPETHLIDYDALRKKAQEFRPKLIIAGASAYPRIIDFVKFKEIADEVGAYLLCDVAHIAGLIVTGEHPTCIGYADFTTTTTHKTLRGPRGGLIIPSEQMAKKINSKIFPGIQGGPLCHTIAAKAVAFQEALQPSFTKYIQQVVKNAKQLAESLMSYDYKLVSRGTDNHLLLVDFSDTDITGKQAADLLDRCHITTNQNTVPNEKRSPMVTSGIRIGTPALTTRGMKEQEMEKIAGFIHQILKNREDEQKLKTLGEEVKEFSNSFPDFQE
jgi:glycine hydroxymethyltransferase